MHFSGHSGDPLRVLVICTGNICRSPLAERLLQQRLSEAGVAAAVGSAGTGAVVGHGMTAQADALALAYGAPDHVHVARQLTSALLGDADLVLTATRAHRSAAVRELPRANRHTFTLREFARLADDVRAGGTLTAADLVSPQALVGAIAAHRGYFAPPAVAAELDILDPYRLPQEVYDEAGRLIDAATRSIADVFADPVAGPRPSAAGSDARGEGAVR